jgi:HK97 family phage prohead protease
VNKRARSDLRGNSLVDLRYADGKHRAAYRTQFEVRSKAGSTVEIEAYASVYDHPYEMYDLFGEYTEVVRAGSGAKTLSENPQVQLLANHEGLSLAYTKAGTLRLSEDTTGLHWAATANTARTDVRDLVLAVEDGNIDECSYAFRCVRQEWSPDFAQRDILEYSLARGDVSLVNFGANPGTAGTPTLGGSSTDWPPLAGSSRSSNVGFRSSWSTPTRTTTRATRTTCLVRRAAR